MDCANQHSHEPLRGEQTAKRLVSIVGSGHAGAGLLVEAAAQATGNAAMCNMPLPAVVRSLTALIDAGKLAVFVCWPEPGSTGGEQAAPPPAIPATPPSKPAVPVKLLTWVVIELVDEDGSDLEGEDYEYTLSDGSVHKGKTGTSPFYADQLPEGVCSIKFPNLHKNHWKAPGSK